MAPLIDPGQTWLVLACVLIGAAASIALEQKSAWGARVGGPTLALGLAMLASNAGLLPMTAPAYDVVDDYLVPVAIPLLLLRADLRRILREAGSLFAAFHLAALGTVLGAVVAAWLWRGAWPQVPEVAGIMTASYTGGSVNFVAVRNTYQVAPELSNPLIVADNFIMAMMFAALIVLAGSRWMRRWFAHPHSSGDSAVDSRELSARHWRRREVGLLDLAQALALAGAIAAVGMGAAGALKARSSSAVVASLLGNPFVWITFLSVAISTAGRRWTAGIQGAEELGMLFLYLFFFVLGVRADFIEVVRNVPMLFAFCLVMAGTNLGVTLVLGRLFRLNLEDLLLSVNATLGGAPSAAAMAISRGWSGLVLPGLLVGIWGYVIGTPLGILVAEVLRRWW